MPKQYRQHRPDIRTSWPHKDLMLLANFLAFIVASVGAFIPQNDMLLPGNDGEYARNTTIQFFRFADTVFSLQMAPFQGMGSLFSLNPSLSPSLIPLPLLGDTAGKWLGFLISAGLVFLATNTLGRSLGMSRSISLLAAWI